MENIKSYIIFFGPFLIPPAGYLLYKYVLLIKAAQILSIIFCALFLLLFYLNITFTSDLVDLIMVIMFIITMFGLSFFLLRIKKEFFKGLFLGLIIFGYYLICLFWTIGVIAGMPDYTYSPLHSVYQSGFFEFTVKEKNLSTALNYNRYFTINKKIVFLPFEKLLTAVDATQLYLEKKPIIRWEKRQDKLSLFIGLDENDLKEIKL